MAEYISQKIHQLIEDIEDGKLILPAMQRNFVWSEEKVCDLFDSILHDYPIGTFLFWEVNKDIVNQYAFNNFISEYNEQLPGLHRGKRVENPSRSEYTGVLDGQQRITSIYIGIRGKYRTKIKGKKKDLDSSYVDKYLCLNVLHQPDIDDHYDFQFIPQDCIGTLIYPEGQITPSEYWIPVSKIFDKDFDAAGYFDYVVDPELEWKWYPNVRANARSMCNNLKIAFYNQNVVNYYLAKKQSLSQVVDIFVRVNSGGEKLSASDLMLSVATGAQSDEDIHVKLQDAIDKISKAAVMGDDTGFVADKELILTAGLMFTNAPSLSLKKAENYTQDRIGKILENWDAIVDSLCHASRFIEHIGFVGRKLTSKNLILPIAYYFYINELKDSHKGSNSVRAKKDRAFIRQWLMRAMINSIFRDGTGSTLLSIRNVIDRSKKGYFPLDDLMKATTKRSLAITDDTIEDILQYPYKDGRVLPLLYDLANASPTRIYQVDHIWAQANMKTKSKVRKYGPTLTSNEIEYFQRHYDYLPNLQIIEAIQNQEKGNELYENWIKSNYPSPEDRYYTDNCIPLVDYDYSNFPAFYEARTNLLRARIRECLPVDFEGIVAHYHL